MFGPPTNLPKKKKGKLQKQLEKQAKTFTPGVPENDHAPPKVVTETPADQLAIKVLSSSPCLPPTLSVLFMLHYHPLFIHSMRHPFFSSLLSFSYSSSEQVAIENAKTMEEVQRVERMIKSGKSQEDTPMADT